MTQQAVETIRRAQAQMQSDAKPPFSAAFAQAKGGR